MQPAHDQRVDVARFDAGHLQRLAPRLVAQRQVLGLAKALLPLLGAGITGRAPPLDELFGGTGRTDQLGDHTVILTDTVTVADDHGRRRVPAAGLVATTGQAGPEVGGDDEGGAR